MKKMKTLIVMLVAIFACIGIAACSSDKDSGNSQTTPKSLVGTTWRGTNAAKKLCVVTFTSDATYHLKVTSLDGKTVYEEDDYGYTYNAETGVASAVYRDDTYAVTVKSNTMSLIMDGKTLVLIKQ